MRDSASVQENLDSRFATWMLRPYLDLGPFQIGPTHAGSIEAGWRSLADPDSPPFHPQRALSPGFRAQLAGLAGRDYAVTDPRALATALRTERWQMLCRLLDGWPDLSSARRWRLALLLHSMCFYDLLLRLIPQTPRSALAGDPFLAQLAFCRASAAFMQDLSTRVPGYSAAIMAAFEELALSDVVHEAARFNATAMVLVQKAKSRAPSSELVGWGKRLEQVFAAMRIDGTTFGSKLLLSRYHRAMGFVPMHGGDRAGLVRTMDLAEQYARELQPRDKAEEILYRENLHAALESRTKEALWLNDVELAVSRAAELTRVDPYDSKAWVELGQVHYLREDWRRAAEAYTVAAILGPPASAIARHMLGVCLNKLGLDLVAAFLFKETLELDPLGISSRQELLELPDGGITDALREWARATIRL